MINTTNSETVLEACEFSLPIGLQLPRRRMTHKLHFSPDVRLQDRKGLTVQEIGIELDALYTLDTTHLQTQNSRAGR
jgi:hypothetical protein